MCPLTDGLYQYGVDLWWCDSTEPFEADWIGDGEMTAGERMQMNVSEAKKYIDPAFVNSYSLYIYKGQRAKSEDKRVLILTRSGYPGQQRHGMFVWNGDT